MNLRLADESDQVDESLEIDIDEPYTILEVGKSYIHIYFKYCDNCLLFDTSSTIPTISRI